MKYEKLYETVRQEVSTKHTMEISEVEERKNGQIASLIGDHNKAFTEIKNYYNDITLNNLALISTMKVGATVESVLPTLRIFIICNLRIIHYIEKIVTYQLNEITIAN